jgi:malonyl-CoA O-methyltransferase
VGNVAGLRVIDVGCGTGRQSLKLAANGAKVTAIDFSQEMLNQARRKPGADKINFVEHDITTRLPFSDGSFEAVFCCLVLDHINDLNSFFGELCRVRRTGGPIFLSVMHPAMMLRGVQARFTDPHSGRKMGPRSYPNQISDYVMAAVGAGLRIEHLSEHAVDAELASRCPRAMKYLNWPMLLQMKFV